MKNVDIVEEKREQRVYEMELNRQNKIKKEFTFLESCDVKEFQAQFVRAQAKEICAYLYRLKFSPFKGWEGAIKGIVEHDDTDFLYQFYITKNEFGEYIPDDDRIKGLFLTDADPEEFPENRR